MKLKNKKMSTLLLIMKMNFIYYEINISNVRLNLDDFINFADHFFFSPQCVCFTFVLLFVQILIELDLDGCFRSSSTSRTYHTNKMVEEENDLCQKCEFSKRKKWIEVRISHKITTGKVSSCHSQAMFCLHCTR